MHNQIMTPPPNPPLHQKKKGMNGKWLKDSKLLSSNQRFYLNHDKSVELLDEEFSGYPRKRSHLTTWYLQNSWMLQKSSHIVYKNKISKPWADGVQSHLINLRLT